MPKKTITTEIARCPFNIRTEDYSLLSRLERNLSGFLSNKEPSFTIDIVNKPKLSPNIDFDSESLDVDIVAQNGTIAFYTKSTPALLLGVIELKKKTATFIQGEEVLNQQYLMPFLRSVFQLFLFTEGGFLIHAAGVIKNDQGYLFPGPSGCGKTTITDLSVPAKILSDEFICVRGHKGSYFMHSTPWKNEARQECVLKKVIFPKKAKDLKLKRMNSGLAAMELAANIIYAFYDRNIFRHILDSLTTMAKEIPCYEMYFSLTSPFWKEVSGDS